MKENQEELEKELKDIQQDLEVDTEAAEDSGVSEVEVENVEIVNLKADLEEMEDKFLRARAEIANMANRGKNEREQLQKYRSQDLAKKLLPSIDNLERALATEVSDEQGASLKKGVEMVLEGVRFALKEEGIEKILQKAKHLTQCFTKQSKLFPHLMRCRQIRLWKFCKKDINYTIAY